MQVKFWLSSLIHRVPESERKGSGRDPNLIAIPIPHACRLEFDLATGLCEKITEDFERSGRVQPYEHMGKLGGKWDQKFLWGLPALTTCAWIGQTPTCSVKPHKQGFRKITREWLFIAIPTNLQPEVWVCHKRSYASSWAQIARNTNEIPHFTRVDKVIFKVGQSTSEALKPTIVVLCQDEHS